MQFRSPLTNLNEALHASHAAYKTVASDILGIDQVELDKLVAASLTTVASCSTAGWYVGQLISGDAGGATGAVIGACVGIVIVIGAVAYRIYFYRTGTELHCTPPALLT